MTIPKTVKVGAITYKVQLDGKMVHPQTWGVTQFTEQVISLDEAMSKERQAEVFLHELMHCAFAQAGLTELFDNKKELTEEEVVNALARSLIAIIRDNKLDFCT